MKKQILGMYYLCVHSDLDCKMFRRSTRWYSLSDHFISVHIQMHQYLEHIRLEYRISVAFTVLTINMIRVLSHPHQ